MAWRMPAETAPHERIWMAFPVEGTTLGDTDALREEGYATWTAVAAAVEVHETDSDAPPPPVPPIQ